MTAWVRRMRSTGLKSMRLPMRLLSCGSSLHMTPPAKLNLSLAILGRRPDGFHELETLMICVSLADTLRLTPRPDGELVLRVQAAGPGLPTVPAGPDNLVLRAANLLREATGTTLGADLQLDKRIPAEAGLAGGSADAAATLYGLNRLWNLALSRDELMALAARLGSDIPFFLCGASAAIARGRGEQLQPLPMLGRLHAVIIKPPFGLGTAAVYRACAELGATNQPGTAVALADALAAGRLDRVARLLRNDLQAAAGTLAPALEHVRRRLHEHCRFGGLMTGSGSACFGLCGSAREATRAAARLRAARLGQVYTVSA